MKLHKSIFLLILFTYINSFPKFINKDTIYKKSNNTKNGNNLIFKGIDSSDIYLTLVNKKHKLPENWLEKIELVSAKNSLGREFLVEKQALEHFNALRSKLLEQGIDIELDSTYRSVERQKELWAEFEETYGRAYCEKYVAVPGYSEHHTGLAIDVCLIKDGRVIDDNDEMIAEVEIFSKVHALLSDYGFILRYLKGKEDITEYSYEPWHFRYVGIKAAKKIYQKRITLEEYLGDI